MQVISLWLNNSKARHFVELFPPKWLWRDCYITYFSDFCHPRKSMVIKQGAMQRSRLHRARWKMPFRRSSSAGWVKVIQNQHLATNSGNFRTDQFLSHLLNPQWLTVRCFIILAIFNTLAIFKPFARIQDWHHCMYISHWYVWSFCLPMYIIWDNNVYPVKLLRECFNLLF